MLPAAVWFRTHPTFFKICSFVFNRRNTHMGLEQLDRVNDDNFHFGVSCIPNFNLTNASQLNLNNVTILSVV